MAKRTRQGFTLIELMIVVVITGVLAAIAIPAFMRYIRRSKTVEASMNVRKLFDSSVAYYMSEHSDKAGAALPRQFPDKVGITPAGRCCTSTGGKCKPEPTTFEDPSWAALNFSIGDPFHFQYQYESADTESKAKFEAYAYGDLDCDGTYSTYMRSGSIVGNNSVTGGAGLFAKNDFE